MRTGETRGQSGKGVKNPNYELTANELIEVETSKTAVDEFGPELVIDGGDADHSRAARRGGIRDLHRCVGGQQQAAQRARGWGQPC